MGGTAGAPLVLLAVAAAAQLGFQLTVTLLVYPALADSAGTSGTGRADWHVVHDQHSRRIVGPVVVLYGALVLLVPAAWLGASASDLPWVRAAAASLLLLLATTMLLAAPTHGALGRAAPERRPDLLRRLRRVDLARLVWSLALAGCTAGALLSR